MNGKLATLAIAGAFAASVFATAAMAGNGAPSGPHYNLNIIGMEKGKTADMTGSNRHVIFMPMKSTKTNKHSKPNFDENGTGVQTQTVAEKIWLLAGSTFKVCDGNGFDFAYGCADSVFNERWVTIGYDSNGNEIPIDERKIGAVFQLPCNTNLNDAYWDSDGDGKVEDNGDDAMLTEIVECGEYIDEFGNAVSTGDGSAVSVEDTANYAVYARALGKPGGSAVTTTCATVRGELQCSLENQVFTSTTGKKVFKDVTDALTSLVIGYCQDDIVIIDGTSFCVADEADPVLGSGDVDWTRVSLFAGNTQDWFWNYDNDGLRLAQLRFYPI